MPDEIIHLDSDGYPTEGSLDRLSAALSGPPREAVAAFYAALRVNHYDLCGPERVEVRGNERDVWGYHTGGWSGNEDIIAVLEGSVWWRLFLERYDRGGHYYFDPPERVLEMVMGGANHDR